MRTRWLTLTGGIAAALTALPAIPEANMTPSVYKDPVPMYRQELSCRFDSPESAARALFRVAALPGGRAVAVTGRWDDANAGNVTAHRLMADRGLRATCYLNSNWECDLHYPDDYRPTARGLLADGHSIGGHSMTHPYITYLHRNRMFQEMMQVRIEWEAELDTPVNSYTFSYIDIRNDIEGDTVHADALECLRRAGYQGIAEFAGHADRVPSELAFSRILPPENASHDEWSRALRWAQTDPERIARGDAISNSMHAWYGSDWLPYGWDVLEARLDALKAVPDAWFCCQNEFAAYWQQARWSRIRYRRDGAMLHVTLSRPTVDWLNDSIPLTLLLDGVSPERLLEIKGADVCREGAPVKVPHAPDQRMPLRIGVIHNSANDSDIRYRQDDPDFPGLHASLHVVGETLSLQIRNDSAHALHSLSAQYRLPLMHAAGVVRRTYRSIPSGANRNYTLAVPLDPARDVSVRYGSAYYAVQLDFQWGDVPARLYVTCQVPPSNDPSLPAGRCHVLGPVDPEGVPWDAWDMDPMTPEALAERLARTWRRDTSSGITPPAWGHPEVVCTTGDWRQLTSPAFFIHARVNSPRRQRVQVGGDAARFQRIWLNGQRLPDKQGALRAGVNDLIVAYHVAGPMGTPAHWGGFLRLCDPQTGRRLDVTYDTETP